MSGPILIELDIKKILLSPDVQMAPFSRIIHTYSLASNCSSYERQTHQRADLNVSSS